MSMSPGRTNQGPGQREPVCCRRHRRHHCSLPRTGPIAASKNDLYQVANFGLEKERGRRNRPLHRPIRQFLSSPSKI